MKEESKNCINCGLTLADHVFLLVNSKGFWSDTLVGHLSDMFDHICPEQIKYINVYEEMKDE